MSGSDLQVIGVGLGRTGTLSLKRALERLGYGPCYHMAELLDRPEHTATWWRAVRGRPVDWAQVFDGYRSTVDWPGCGLWRELVAAHPEAVVVLTVRDPQRWYDSARRTIFAPALGTVTHRLGSLVAMLARPRGALQLDLMRRLMLRAFDLRLDDRAHVVAAVERHEAEVIAAIDPERLLVFRVSEGWEPLCSFLGAPLPDEPFPHINESVGDDDASYQRIFADRLDRDRRRGLRRIGIGAALASAIAVVGAGNLLRTRQGAAR